MAEDTVGRLRAYVKSAARYGAEAVLDPDDAQAAADEIERLWARVDLLSGWLEGALNVIDVFVACDTSDARAALDPADDKETL